VANQVRRRHGFHRFGDWGPDFANSQAMAATSTASQSQLALGEFQSSSEAAGHVLKELSWRNGTSGSARVFVGGLLPDSAWGAGQYDLSANAFLDDTTDAQDAGVGDFHLQPASGASSNDGFIIHADRPFTACSVIVSTTHGSVSHTVSYLDGGTFVAMPSVVVQPTLIGDTAEDQVIIWSKPPSWDASTSGGPSGIATGRYVVAITFSGTAGGAAAQIRVGNWRWACLLLPSDSAVQGSSMDVPIASEDERPWALYDNGPAANHQVSLVTELSSVVQKIGS